ncbi:MAG: hypothetical protein Tsb0019_37630 [Roseibium sp.]
MNSLALLKTAAIAAAVSRACPVAADPPGSDGQPDLSAARIVLASLNRDLDVPALPNMSRRVSSAAFLKGPAADQAPLIRIAGRRGSSQYDCDSPGFTYCCGNSTDGYYCAADMSGCTR